MEPVSERVRGLFGARWEFPLSNQQRVVQAATQIEFNAVELGCEGIEFPSSIRLKSNSSVQIIEQEGVLRAVSDGQRPEQSALRQTQRIDLECEILERSKIERTLRLFYEKL